MEKKIIINFGKIVEEMEKKKIRLCFVNSNRGLFVLDKSDNLYQIEILWHNSYLDKLINNHTNSVFNLVDNSKSENIEGWEREIWDIKEVEKFIEMQSKY